MDGLIMGGPNCRIMDDFVKIVRIMAVQLRADEAIHKIRPIYKLSEKVIQRHNRNTQSLDT